MKYKPTICDTCRRNCNMMDRSRGTACKDYEKKKKTKKIAPQILWRVPVLLQGEIENYFCPYFNKIRRKNQWEMMK